MKLRSKTTWVVGAAVVALFSVAAASSLASAGSPDPTVVVYKNPNCGCCDLWAEQMAAQGFDVEIDSSRDMAMVYHDHGITPEISACHVALVDGYIVSGHVPIAEVQRLLRERPEIDGIAVAGMPVGSPGMETPSGATEPYDVLAFGADRTTSIYARYRGSVRR